MATTAATAEPSPAFPVTPYQHTPSRSGTGIIGMVIVGLVAAVVSGAVASTLGQFIYFIFLYPLVIGAVVGNAMARAAKESKMRSPFAAGFVGLWCGFVAMFVVHYGDFFWAKSSASFLNFLQSQAQKGVSIGLRFDINLGYTGTVLYWVAEIVVVALIVLSVCAYHSAAPFCTACNEWKVPKLFGPFDIEPEHAKQLVEKGEAARIGHIIPTVEGPHLMLTVMHCPKCVGAGAVEVFVRKVNPQADLLREIDGLPTTYPGEALAAIESATQPTDWRTLSA